MEGDDVKLSWKWWHCLRKAASLVELPQPSPPVYRRRCPSIEGCEASAGPSRCKIRKEGYQIPMLMSDESNRPSMPLLKRANGTIEIGRTKSSAGTVCEGLAGNDVLRSVV